MQARTQEAYRRVLVIKLRHFGDVLLSTPVFAALKEYNSGAEIFAAVNQGTDQVLQGNPHLTGVLQTPAAGSGALLRWKRELRFVRDVRRRKFDLVLDLTTSDRSAILTRLSGAPRRIGYRSVKGFAGRSRCYTETVQGFGGKEHIVLKHMRILEPILASTPNPALVFVVREDARSKLLSLIPPNEKFFQVHPVSRVPKKNWSVPNMAACVESVAKRGWRPVITGSSEPSERAWIKQLRQQLRCDYLDLSARLNFEELGALSERAQCFLGVDTAPMHIAAAMNTPVIGIFGPTSERMWGPWCDKKLVLSRTDLDCRLPCRDKHHCPHIACLTGFTAEMCLPQIDRFLDDVSEKSAQSDSLRHTDASMTGKDPLSNPLSRPRGEGQGEG